ncbi:MAG: histidinol dehydrogenase [Vicinamibacterales bacterium]
MKIVQWKVARPGSQGRDRALENQRALRTDSQRARARGRALRTTDDRDAVFALPGDSARSPAVQRQVARIVGDVRRRGDAAVREWALKLDGLSGPVEVSQAELRRGWKETPKEIRAAIRVAVRNVGRVASLQKPRPFTVEVRKGVQIDQRVQPLAHVGCYVPGGRYPLVSSLIMTVVPARKAGVRTVTVMCPSITPAICCAAIEAGATRLLRIGGAQAIAALAYGTASIARADKIVGPGSAWVAAAKALVAPDCAIDFHAGPSEIVVWSDRGRADWIAADLVAQAEHDPDARAILVTTRPELAKAVAGEVRRALVVARAEPQARDRGLETQAALRTGAPAALRTARSYGSITAIVVRTRDEAVALVNRLAPEHLVCDTKRDAACITSAGTIFVGSWSAQAAGDYVTGSNHVLPTGGAGRFRGGLSTADFVRVFTVQTLTRAGIDALSRSAIVLAESEGLTAHAESIRCRASARLKPRPTSRLKPRAASLLKPRPTSRLKPRPTSRAKEAS